MLWHMLNSKFSLQTNIGNRHILYLPHTEKKKEKEGYVSWRPPPAPVSLFPTTGKGAVFLSILVPEIFFTGELFLIFLFYVHYSTLLHLPPLRFHCVGGCRDRTQDCCDFGIDSQTLWPLGYISSINLVSNIWPPSLVLSVGIRLDIIPSTKSSF